MKTIILEGNLRENTGSKAAADTRRNGEVPCVLYGGTDVVHFSAPYNSFLGIIYTPDFLKVQVNVGGKGYEAIVKEIQFDPVKDTIIHIDFLELVPGKKIVAEIPVELTGTPKGVLIGGKLVLNQRKLKVKTTPEFLIGEIKVDVSDLELGKSQKVGNINIPNIEILSSPNIPLASVTIPRSLRSKMTEAEKK